MWFQLCLLTPHICKSTETVPVFAMTSIYTNPPSQQKECLQKAESLAMKHIPTTHSSCYTSLGASHTTKTSKRHLNCSYQQNWEAMRLVSYKSSPTTRGKRLATRRHERTRNVSYRHLQVKSICTHFLILLLCNNLQQRMWTLMG